MRLRPAGFSLVEVLVVTAVLAVLLQIALPRLIVPETLGVRIPARQLAADLRLAQRLAIARRVEYLVQLAPATPPYAGYVLRAQGGPPEPDFPKTFEPGVDVTGAPEFRFQPDGSAASGGSVTLTTGGATAAVQVTAPTGRVTVSGP